MSKTISTNNKDEASMVDRFCEGFLMYEVTNLDTLETFKDESFVSVIDRLSNQFFQYEKLCCKKVKLSNNVDICTITIKRLNANEADPYEGNETHVFKIEDLEK